MKRDFFYTPYYDYGFPSSNCSQMPLSLLLTQIYTLSFPHQNTKTYLNNNDKIKTNKNKDKETE